MDRCVFELEENEGLQRNYRVPNLSAYFGKRYGHERFRVIEIIQDVDDEQSEGDDPDVDHKNGPFNVVDQFDLQITPSQFRRLCGLAAMATYQAEWGGQRGHIVHSLSTGELEASEVSQSFQMIERTLTVGSRTKFERFGRANHRYVL